MDDIIEINDSDSNECTITGKTLQASVFIGYVYVFVLFRLSAGD